ncbi:MAG: DUF1580 domain-containing protein [Pirellulaceae bacterium]
MKFDDTDILSLAEAARVVPGDVSPSTIWRWATSGQRGVILASLRVGGRLYTSRCSLHDFFEELTCRANSKPRPMRACNSRATTMAILREQGFKV